MAPREGVSKWQRKSVAVTAIRWELEKILNDDLEPEEKNSPKYRELVNTVYLAIDHAVPPDQARTVEVITKKHEKKKKWTQIILYSIATSAGAIVAALIPYIPVALGYVIKACNYLTSLLSQTPPTPGP